MLMHKVEEEGEKEEEIEERVKRNKLLMVKSSVMISL